MAETALRILFVEDNDIDVELEQRQLAREGLTFDWCVTRDEKGLREALRDFAPHIVLCDYSIPGFSGRQALSIVRSASPQTPFIFVSGTIGEETAVECLREGALDYVLKDNPRRLASAVRRALAETDERNAYEERIRHLANFDPLSGLPNRTLLRDRIDQAIVHDRRTETGIAVIVINLDGFRRVNAAFGNAAGDDVLRTTAKRLAAALRPGDTLARSGGDEFTALVSELARPEDATPVVQALLEAARAPHEIGPRMFSMTATGGIASFPADGKDAETLLAAAHAAMHEAKSDRRGEFLPARSSDAMRQSLRRVMIESNLVHALKREELKLVYQLQYDLATRHASGMESLMRWGSRAESPGSFIPVAEETGRIRELGLWALREACTSGLAWAHRGLTLGVNVSPLQLLDKTFVATLECVLAETGFPARSLEIEVTESALMRGDGGVLEMLHALRATGVGIAIDDFGTGYSSLAYLSRLPIGKLKIDAGFVQRMAADERDAKIVQSIISLGHGLGLKVIAEGVETEAQLEMLRGMACDQVQGFLFSPPVAAEEIERLLS
jgi:diguanylate cyclase (GGDEF)-like protein